MDESQILPYSSVWENLAILSPAAKVWWTPLWVVFKLPMVDVGRGRKSKFSSSRVLNF